MLRHEFRPGVTGLAEISGWRAATDTPEGRKGRAEADLWNLENWSLSLDIKIILMTVFSRNAWRNAVKFVP
jgi:lipopolysaccharide/colanic/teichoic acid biosynthesis glycosyltransferase